LNRLEDRTLLATMVWTNSGGGDWDSASNWVNQADSTDHHVPTKSDDAEISLSGVTVTHTSSAPPDEVNSLTTASGTTLSLSNGSLALDTTSSIAGGLTLQGATLTTAGGLTVTGSMEWDAGTVSGSGTLTIASRASLSLGDNSGVTEILSGVALWNYGATSWDVGGSGVAGSIELEAGAAIFNYASQGGTFLVLGDGFGSIYVGDNSRCWFTNAGLFEDPAIGGGSAAIDLPFLNTGTVNLQRGYLSLGGYGLWLIPISSGAFYNEAGTNLNLIGQSLSTTSQIVSSGTTSLHNCTIAGLFSTAGPVIADNTSFFGPVDLVAGSSLHVESTVTFAPTPASGGPVTLTTDEITITPGGNLAGTDSFVVKGTTSLSPADVNSQPLLPGAALSITGSLEAEGSLYLGGYNQITGTTVVNLGLGTLDLNNSQSVVLTSGAKIINGLGGKLVASGTEGFGKYIVAGDSSSVGFVNHGTLEISGTLNDNAVINVPFSNDGDVVVDQGAGLSLKSAVNSRTLTLDQGAVLGANIVNSGTLTVEAGAAFGILGDSYSQVAGTTVLEGGAIEGGFSNIEGGSVVGFGTIEDVTNAGQFSPGGSAGAGVLSVYGFYTQTATGSLDIGIGGPTAGSQYDQLAVSGNATIAGQLNVSLSNNFQPNGTDSFQVVTAGAFSGGFTGQIIPAGLILSQSASGNNSALTLLVDSVSGITTYVNTAASGSSVTLPAISTSDLLTALGGVNTATPTGPVTVAVNLASDTTYNNTPLFSRGGFVAAPLSNVNLVISCPSGKATVNDLTASGSVRIHGSRERSGGLFSPPSNIYLVGKSAALIVNGGQLIVESGVTITTATDDPAVVVNGGSLVVRESTIDQSSSYDQPAIQIKGGTVDLGTPTDPGGNTINADGTSQLIENSTSTPVPISDDNFTVNGVSVPISLSVTNTAGSGLSSLPYAVLEANTNPGIAGSIIGFDPTAFAAPQTITLSSTLVLNELAGPEAIEGPLAGVVISGGSRPGFPNGFGDVQVDNGTTATLSGLTFSASSTNGIDNSGILTVKDSAILGDALGIGNEPGATLTVADSAILGDALGIRNEPGATLTIINSTIANGFAGTGVDNFGTLTAVNTTIAYNRNGGGLHDEPSSTGTLYSTIVAYNTTQASKNYEDISGGVSAASSYNLIGPGGSGGLTDAHGNQVGVLDPGLAPQLEGNEGQTKTLALLPGSPAIGKGGPVTTLSLAGVTDTSSTSISMANGLVFAASSLPELSTGSYFLIQVDSEQMAVTAVALNADDTATLTVVRGVNGTAATTHTGGAPVLLASDQRGDLMGPGGPDIGAFEAPVFLGPTAYTVTNTCDDPSVTGSLPWAINQANNQGNPNYLPANPSGSQIMFAIPTSDPGYDASNHSWTITLSGTLELSEEDGLEVIQGPGESALTINGNHSVRVFLVDPNTAATISGLTISGGSATEGFNKFGGGIWNNGELRISDCAVADNHADFLGGGIVNNGGGIPNSTEQAAGILTVTDSKIEGNSATHGGGGVYNSFGFLAITDSTIAENHGTSGGGVLDLFAVGTIKNSTVVGNSATIGGGLSVFGGSLTIARSTIADNQATNGSSSGVGGGIALVSASATITGSTIANNTATRSGGGIFLQGGTLTIADSTIADNTATSSGHSGGGTGGGLWLGGSEQVTDSTIANNTAALGGGVFTFGGTLTIADSTIADNEATAVAGGGGLDASPSCCPSHSPVVTLDNTIVADNRDPSGHDDIVGVVSAASAYNLIGTGGSGGLVDQSTDPAQHNRVGVADLGLGPLENNGGPTETVALLPNSPAIGAGSVNLIPIDPATGEAIATDQRGAGYQRTVTVNGTPTVDIGAFEAQQVATSTTVTSSSNPSVSGESVTFTATISPLAPRGGAPTGTVTFMDATTALDTETLSGGTASFTTAALAVGSHSITAVYSGDPDHFTSTSAGLAQQVNDLTPANLQNVITGAQSSGATVTLTAATTSTLTNTLSAITSLPSATSGTVVVDLSNNATYQQQDSSGNTIPIVASAPSGTALTIRCSTGNATVYDLQAAGGNVDIHGSANGTITVVGTSPALKVTGGSVTIGSRVTLVTATAAPTILVSGGSLTIRNATIQESNGSAQAAILITGGRVDLGTTTSPGGNVFNVNGAGTLIQNTSASPVPAVGDTFENNGAPITPNFGVVSLSAPSAQTANQGVPKSFTLGSLTDTVNDSQSWTVDVNWGDGSVHTGFNATSTGALSAQSHAFALPGTYTITVTAADPVASGVTTWSLVRTFSVTVAPSLFVLNATASGALTLSGNTTVNIPGAIVVDSSSTTAISASGNSQLTASVIDVAGGVQKAGTATISPVPATGASLNDPLASLSGPNPSGTSTPVSLTKGSQTINPGVYSQISVSGSASLT
jgi:hypothetical protein